MMSHTLRAILCIFSLWASACGHTGTDDQSKGRTEGPQVKLFYGSYDEVWRALQKSLIRYPIQVNNIDTGLIETEPIRGDTIWISPLHPKGKPLQYKYVLSVRVTKGQSGGQDSVRVAITKSILLEKDFFSGESRTDGDGHEELALLYRLEREMALEHSLRRAFEKSQPR